MKRIGLAVQVEDGNRKKGVDNSRLYGTRDRSTAVGRESYRSTAKAIYSRRRLNERKSANASNVYFICKFIYIILWLVGDSIFEKKFITRIHVNLH